MTERLDLSGIGPTREATDRVVGAVMARVRSPDGRSPGGVLDVLAVSVRFRWMAAAAVLLAAVALALTSRIRPSAASMDQITQWISSRHIPSNSELLAVFQGYRQ
jgi:hypothetical protein